MKRGVLVLGLGAALWVSACSSDSGKTLQDQPLLAGQCRTAADCTGTEQCLAPGGPIGSADFAAPRHASIAFDPCFNAVACTTDEACGDGFICQTPEDMAVVGLNAFPECGFAQCTLACTEASCGNYHSCGSDGHCNLLPCTDPNFPGCPTNWSCNETLAATPLDPAAGVIAGGNTPFGAVPEALDPNTLDFATRAGCERLPCDDPQGVQCADGYRCDPENAAPDGVGCVAIPCDELGRCSNDTIYTCEPTSTNSRFPGMDDHGCVQKNCEEGLDCGTNQICDFSRPDATQAGCSYIQCDEPNGSCPDPVNTKCDPDNPAANAQGCAPLLCTEGYQCPLNQLCDPSANDANQFGCRSGGSNNENTKLDDVRPGGLPPGSACDHDAECERGYCFQNQCGATLGQCQ